MEIIKIENLSTIFGENIVHNNISFSINEKEIFGVLGGSGSGKTVLVKQIVMLNEIQKGTIKIFDKDISNLNLEQSQEIKEQFSYLFQFGALFSFLTVIENINGADAYAIKNGKSTYFYDVKTGFKVAEAKELEQEGQKMTQTTYFQDYKDVKGLKFPYKTIMNVGIEIELITTEVKINEGVTDADFK